ncbi:Pentatricopeptide repeat-containing protein [Dendrobium catenatum]|uniref:Pentatricopeptide repeat-containing protein n=1 Tax=Dendrobium catenatum TaxID=906689 RepID=A0A2I0VCT4_9ASPA|nr:Pentatricopeptide repeat-containing protein [Dendrobium catenatum]
MMEKEELEPNEITFVSVLHGCCIAGLVDKGLEYFDLMNIKYGIEPGLSNMAAWWTCMAEMGDSKRPLYRRKILRTKFSIQESVFCNSLFFINEPRTESSSFYARGV